MGATERHSAIGINDTHFQGAIGSKKHQLYRSRLPYFYLVKVGKSTDERQPINFVDPSTRAINFGPHDIESNTGMQQRRPSSVWGEVKEGNTTTTTAAMMRASSTGRAMAMAAALLPTPPESEAR